MDGTGDLFEPLAQAMKPWGPHGAIDVVRYSGTEALGYDELERLVRAQLPRRPALRAARRIVLGPLAISIAASPPPGLRGSSCAAALRAAPSPGWR
jgi:hypothetical protein